MEAQRALGTRAADRPTFAAAVVWAADRECLVPYEVASRPTESHASEAHEAALPRGESRLRVDAVTGDAALTARVDANSAMWSTAGGSVPYLLGRGGSEGL